MFVVMSSKVTSEYVVIFRVNRDVSVMLTADLQFIRNSGHRRKDEQALNMHCGDRAVATLKTGSCSAW